MEIYYAVLNSLELKEGLIEWSYFYSHAHKAAVMSVQWNVNGNWLLTGARDHLIKIFDLRVMKEISTLRSHKKEVNGKQNSKILILID